MILNQENKIKLFNLNIFSKDKDILLEEIKQHLKNQDQLKIVFTPNSEQVVAISRNKSYYQLFLKADYLIPDGYGLVWASKMLNANFKDKTLKERIAGIDLTNDLLKLSLANNWPCLLIGGRNYHKIKSSNWIIKKVENLDKVYYFVNIDNKGNFFWFNGFDDKNSMLVGQIREMEVVLEKLKIKCILVALGFPDQEKFIIDNSQILVKKKIQLPLVVGGSFDMILNKVKRAPFLIQQWHLEWLWRLFRQPWRLKRQLQLIRFVLLVFKQKLKNYLS